MKSKIKARILFITVLLVLLPMVLYIFILTGWMGQYTIEAALFTFRFVI